MTNPVAYNFTNDINNAYHGKVGNNAEYKRFNEEYFAGSDVRIYFGNTWVDEIVSLQFTLQENTAPIFGYASYTYDRVAIGSRQIQGTFRINFKESYYLQSITNRVELELQGLQDPGSTTIGNTTYINPQEEITPEHLVSTVNNSDFERIALEYEKALWGKATNGTGLNTSILDRRSTSFFEPLEGRPQMAEHGMNIVILYGPYTQSYKKDALTESVATTAHTLTGVYLTGVNQVIDNSGQPIFEEYSFIAKDLDGNVNTYPSSPQYKFGQVVK